MTDVKLFRAILLTKGLNFNDVCRWLDICLGSLYYRFKHGFNLTEISTIQQKASLSFDEVTNIFLHKMLSD